jgi:hypothetical protein
MLKSPNGYYQKQLLDTIRLASTLTVEVDIGQLAYFQLRFRYGKVQD